MLSPSQARAKQPTATHSSIQEAEDIIRHKSVAARSKVPSSGRVIAAAGSTIASPTLRSRSAPEGPSLRLSSPTASVNDTLRVLSSGVDVRVSDEELMALIPRLRRADAPTTKLLASPFEDLFILRAAVGDFEDIIRRLARGQNVNALHSQLLYPALHAAAGQGQAEMVAFLVEHGADVAQVHEPSGDTALHFAVAAGQHAAVEELVKRGADPLTYNKKGQRAMDIGLEYRRAQSVRFLGDVPKAPARLRMVGHTKDSWTLEWDAPFSDGVWIDSHEIQIVRLPDTYLPGGSVTSSHEFDESALSQQLKVHDGNFMSDAIEGPWTVIGNHYPGHTVASIPPWTAYRCRVRVNTIVGWSDFSKAVVVHTAGDVPSPPDFATILDHNGCNLNVEWGAPRPNGATITFYALQVKTVPAWVDEDGVVHRGEHDLNGTGSNDSATDIEAGASTLSMPSFLAASLSDEADGDVVDEAKAELSSPMRRRKATPAAGISGTGRQASQSSLLQRSLRSKVSTSSVDAIVYPSLERPTTELTGNMLREPAPITPLESLDVHHPYMWQYSVWVKRPRVEVERRRSPSRRVSHQSHASYISQQSSASHTTRGSHGASAAAGAHSIDFASPSSVHLSTDSIMPFLPTESTESLTYGGSIDSLKFSASLGELSWRPQLGGAAFGGQQSRTPPAARLSSFRPLGVSDDVLGISSTLDTTWAHPALRSAPTLFIPTGTSPSRRSQTQVTAASESTAYSSSSMDNTAAQAAQVPRISDLALSSGIASNSIGTTLASSRSNSTGTVRRAESPVRHVPEPLIPPNCRPQTTPGWFNTGDLITSDQLSGMLYDIASERDVFVRCFAWNRFGWSAASEVSEPYWMPNCPSVLKSFPRALRITLGSQGAPPFQLQTQICSADAWNGAPLSWRPPQLIAGSPYRAEGYNDPRNPPDAPWVDALVTPEDNMLRAATVYGLQPYSRYRARVRCAATDAAGNTIPGSMPPWESSPISDWYLTQGDVPEKVELLHATTWEKRAMLVQWKLPRINGSLITRFTLQRMRVRPQDEGDSDTSSDDNLTSSSSSDDESETIDAHARDTPVRRTPVGAGGVIISEEDAARARIAAAAKKLAARRAAAAAEVSKAEKTRPVYDEWTTVIEEGDIVEAASIALGVRQREDLALSKLQQASPAEFDDVLRDLLRRDAYGATVRFMRIAMVLRSGRQLTAADIAEHPEEPDVAVIMRDVPPGSHYQFRVKVLNSLGWSDWNDADAVTRQNGMRPLQPAAPLVLQHTSTHLLVCWALPRSHGAVISGFDLRHKRTLMSKHPDETDSDPDPPAERTPFNGPMGRVKVYKPSRSKWKPVPIPDFVKNATRVQEPFTKDELSSGGRDIDLVTGVKMSLKQQELAYEVLQRGRQWAYSIVGPFKPCSRHQFTVQARNSFGASKFSVASNECELLPDRPVQPMAPYTAASSSDAIILYWIEPCHNGVESSDYHIQCRRVFTSGPDDSESDESVSVDTTDWIDSITVPVGDVIGSFRMTGAPDIVKLMGVRGKRRFGRKCSYPVAKLRAGKTYQFRIRARNDIGWSDFSGPSQVCRTIAREPDPPNPVLVSQHLPRILRVMWNPPRSNGSKITQIVLQQQMLSVNWREELQQETDLIASQAKADSSQADDEQTMKECMARRMHPASTSVLQRAALANASDSGWVTVPLSAETELSMDVKPAPSASAHAELPLSPDGVSLLVGRPYTDVLIKHLVPESVYRFRIRFANAREFGPWSKPSYPCTVFGDWPDQISKPPVVVSRTPFSLFLNWHEPEGNGAPILAYHIQRRRVRFRPEEPEPHPDDSDSAPEDGNYSEPWSDVAEISGSMCRYFGKPEVLESFNRSNASSHSRPQPSHDALWLDRHMELATAAVAKVENESALLMQSESAVVRHAASKGDYVAGQLVGWPVLGLRPGTRHLFRVNGKNVLGYPKFSEESLIYPTRPVFPEVPADPVAFAIRSDATKLGIKTVAARSNGAEVYEIEVWRMRIRGGDAPDASDSEADESLDVDERDSNFIMCFSAIPEACVVKAAKLTSGHSKDKLRIVIDGIRPGTRQVVKLRATNIQGHSEFTAVSNIVQGAPMTPGTPTDVVVYFRTASTLHITWTAPRSRGARIQGYCIQRRRLKSKFDHGVPSDDELDILQAAAAGQPADAPRTRRRIEGKMLDVYEHAWQDIGWVDDAQLVLPPPVDYLHAMQAPPTELEATKEANAAVPVIHATPEEIKRDISISAEYVCKPDVASRIEAMLDGDWEPESSRPAGMTSVKYRYFGSDALKPNTTHEFRVCAWNAVGWSEWSQASAPMKCLLSAPYRPGRPHLSSGSFEPVIIRWEPARSNGHIIKNYELSYVTLGGDVNVETDDMTLITAAKDESDWVIQAVTPGRSCSLRTVMYQATLEERMAGTVVRRVYRVRANNASGWGSFSEHSELIVLSPETV